MIAYCISGWFLGYSAQSVGKIWLAAGVPEQEHNSHAQIGKMNCMQASVRVEAGMP